MQTISMSKVFDAMMAIVAGGESPCLIGASGIGKTQVVGQLANAIDADGVLVHLMSSSPEDLKFPVVDVVNETVTFIPAKQFMAGKKRKLFFWDEVTHAPTSLQSICYGVFEGNRIGDYTLPADSIHIAAHNRQSDKGVHNRIPHPLRRRWIELHVEPDLAAWEAWARKAGVDPLVIGFVKWRPEFLYQDMQHEQLSPDPRAWAKLSNIIAANPGIAPDILHAIVEGKIGEAVGSEFIAFLRLYQSLPSLDAIIADPMRAKLHNNPGTMYAIAAGLSRKMTVANIGACIKYLNRMATEQNAAEFGVLAVKDAVLRDKALKGTPEATKWAIANQDIVI